MNKKRFLIVFIVVILGITSGCGKKDEVDPNNDNSITTTTTAATTTMTTSKKSENTNNEKINVVEVKSQLDKAYKKKISKVPNGWIGIYSETDLIAIKENLAGKYILMENIVLASPWNPLAMDRSEIFQGELDGNGLAISHLKINKENSNKVGMFSKANGNFKNINIVEASISGGQQVGILIGETFGAEVENVYVSGKITGWAYIGGIIGQMSSSASIKNSYANANVNGNNYVGGLVGEIHGSTSIERSYAIGQVAGKTYIGGLVGQMSSASTLRNSYANVTVQGNSNVGGLVGETNASAEIRNCYAVGLVTGANDVGGLVGKMPSTSGTYNSFYDKDTTGQGHNGYGTPFTTSKMKAQSTYSGWDFKNIWKIKDNTYPTLR